MEYSSSALNGAQYHWHAQKPYYLLRLSVVEPKQFLSQPVVGRVYCTPKALWKLSWFLRDFGYDTELFAHDEIEGKRLIGLQGVVKISPVVNKGATLLNLDAFAPAEQWNQLSAGSDPQPRNPEVSS